jgi:large subunit ribosomal protein L10
LAISRETKEEILKGYIEVLSNAQGMVITEYRGMGMNNFNAIRGLLRPVNGQYTVTKNTLFKIALRETGFAVPEDLLAGPTAVAIAYADLSSVAKAVLARKKDDELLILKGAIMGETVFRGEDQVTALSTMPTLPEARASLIGLLQTPAVRIVSLLGQPATELAMVLKAYSDKANEAA